MLGIINYHVISSPAVYLFSAYKWCWNPPGAKSTWLLCPLGRDAWYFLQCNSFSAFVNGCACTSLNLCIFEWMCLCFVKPLFNAFPFCNVYMWQYINGNPLLLRAGCASGFIALSRVFTKTLKILGLRTLETLPRVFTSCLQYNGLLTLLMMHAPFGTVLIGFTSCIMDIWTSRQSFHGCGLL